MEFIRATYRLTCEAAEVEKIARDIAVEQTVEVPESLITSERIREEIVGRVEAIQPSGDGSFDARIAYNADLASGQIGQLLNLVYGNISMKRNIRLMGMELPDSLLASFRGPNFGVEGIRRTLGVYGRPLLATALKPKGSSAEELAAIAGEFARGGGDLVKDDHNLVETSFDEFRSRVKHCQQAVSEAADQTGRPTLYFPNILAPVGTIERQVEFAVRQGVRGILIAPMLVGPDYVRHLAETYNIAIMAHPTFSGAFFHDPLHGMEPALLLGTLFRLIGCDFSIFPNAGGRFTFSDGQCREIGRSLQSPLGSVRPAFPAPAGGMRFETIPAMADQYGADSVFLIGGALLGHSQSLRESTAKFLASIEEHFPDSRTEEPDSFASACELPGGSSEAAPLEHLPFREGFRWEGREPVAYKESAELPFKDVSRIELIGKAGEQSAFDVRYFEVGPGGHSSLEKHVHTHVVIGTRGEGVLISGERRIVLRPHDVAYVPPLRVHQLKNETDEPFGFFCIVDRNRDRPQRP